jgi:hypothetical protein
MKTCDLCKKQIIRTNDENEIKCNGNIVISCENCYQRMCDIIGKLTRIGFNGEIYKNIMESIEK